MWFAHRLLPALEFQVEERSIRVRSFAADAPQTRLSEPQIAEFPIDVSGRHILVLDYIADTGLTLRLLERHFLERGAVQFDSAALVTKIHPHLSCRPTWEALVYEGSDWLFGCGMDIERGLGRQLCDLMAVPPPN